MNRMLIAALLIITAGIAFAQVPDWQWAMNYGNYGDDYGYDLTTDAANNVYLAGGFQVSAQFGGTTLSSAGGTDVLVVKADAAGNAIWAVRGGGNGNDIASAVAVAANGDVYIQGTFYNTATFGTHSVTSGGQSDIFVAKLNSAGEWQWAVSASTSATDTAGQIALDSEGNAYVTGTIWGAATFGTISIPAIGYKDVYVAKVSSGGSWIWANLAGGTNSDEGWGIATDASGNIYISGSVFGTVNFGSFNYTSSHSDAIVAKLNSAGEWQWLTTSSGSAPEYAENLCLDASGNIYVGGFYYTDGWYAPQFGTITPPELGTHTMYVAKLSSAGAWTWVKAAGALLSPGGNSSQNNKVKSLVNDASGNLWVTGTYEGNAQFGDQTVPFIGGVDGFLAKLDASGTWLLIESFGGANADWGYGVAVDSNDNAYVTGFYNGTIGFGDISLPSAGAYDGFFAMYGEAGTTTSPEIGTDLASLDFGVVWLGSSGNLDLVIQSTGTGPLTIDQINLAGQPSAFSFTPPALPLTLPPGAELTLGITFTPTQSVEYQDQITIVSNAENQPSLQIGLSGEGQYVAPAMVQNVNVAIVGMDAVITWDAVTQSEIGTPLVPDRYIVLYNETPYEQDQFYYYLASTTGTSFTHQEVALFRTQMFYRVVAVKFYRDEDAAWLNGLSASDKISWNELKGRLTR